VARIWVAPPESRIGPLTSAERTEQLARSPLKGRYDQAVDRESAHELLKQRGEQAAQAAEEQQAAAKPARRGREPESMATAMAKSAARAIGSQIGRQIVRGVLGSLLGGSSRRR
jgi:predicted RNA-binding Zn ribbon-like protein